VAAGAAFFSELPDFLSELPDEPDSAGFELLAESLLEPLEPEELSEDPLAEPADTVLEPLRLSVR